MTEPFKNNFSKKLIREMAKHFKNSSSHFNDADFIKMASLNLEQLELKERSLQITQAIIEYLPRDFERAGGIILDSLGSPIDEKGSTFGLDQKGISGWGIMPLTHFVGLCGHEHFELSMDLLKEMTKRFSSEFDIRFFLIKSPKKTLKTLEKWALDRDHHVRRLASEGCRPRLPWAMMLPDFIENPSPVISILEKLKDDESEYVRRSVSNNLNDISKDHPDLIAKLAKEWLKVSTPERTKLVRHACRTLIKSGHKKTLKAFGYNSPKLKTSKVKIKTPNVEFGKSLDFDITISSDTKKTQDLIIDYIIHHQKANGTTSPKVYKWKVLKLPGNENLTFSKTHKIKQITTRVYHPGEHFLEVVANGESIGKRKFNLVMKK